MISASTISLLIDAGLGGDTLKNILFAIEDDIERWLTGFPIRREKSASAIRTARYRERMKELGYSTGEWNKLREVVLSVYDPTCVYCGADNPRTVDHVIPVSKGGLTDLSNLVPCCRECNSSKCDKDPKEFIRCQ